MIEISADNKTLKRLKFAAVALIALSAVVGIRLFQLQILQHARLFAKSEQQYTRTLHLEPQRGTIYDRNMKALADSVPVSSLYANPALISDPSAIAAKLAPILGVPEDKLSARLERSGSFTWVQRKITPTQAKKIAALNLPSLGFIPENKRYYPKRSLAAQVLGFVGTDNKGLEGLEFKYDRYVGGKPSLVLVEKDAKGRKIYASKRPLREGSKGLDIVLNIDETVQYIAEKELAEQVVSSRAKGGIAIVMDPYTGEILALAQQPSYNPNSFLDYRPSRWKGSAVSDPYEPGSTFKMITLATVLEEGLARQEQMIYAEKGSMRLYGETYNDVHAYSWLTVKEVITKSSNIGTIKLGQRLKPDIFYRYIKKFGFGSKTGIDLPGENPGLIRDPGKWSKVSQASLSIGYEISVTPIQLIRAYAAVANGGLLVRPRVVRGVMKNGRLVEDNRVPQEKRVISAKTAEAVTSILKEVVEKGTGKRAAVPGYAVAGKTGTVKKYDSRLKKYSPDKYIASFVGFFPADDPRAVILVLIDEPMKNGYYGSAAAAPVFSRIASQLARYLKIPTPGNLLRVAALEPPQQEEPAEESGGNIRRALARINRGVKELIGKVKASFMGPMERRMAGNNAKGGDKAL